MKNVLAITGKKLGLLLRYFVSQITVGDLFCVGGFVLLGAGLWEVSRPLALCTTGGLMLIVWMLGVLRATKKEAR